MGQTPKLEKPFWLTDLLPFVIGWSVDRLTKVWALALEDSLSWGPWLIDANYNFGIIMGSFSDYPPVMRQVIIASLGAFIFFAYVFVRSFFTLRSSVLKVGISLQLSGIMGNVTDRLMGDGGVVDFVSLSIGSFQSQNANLADAFQIIGYVLVIFGFRQEVKYFWPNKESRRTLWINQRFQMRFCILIVGSGLAVGLVTSLMGYTFLRSTLQSFGISSNAIWPYLSTFLLIVFVLQASAAMALFLLGKYLSSRIAGPIYAIQKYIEDTLSGHGRSFKLRKHDEFKELETSLSHMNEKYRRLQELYEGKETEDVHVVKR